MFIPAFYVSTDNHHIVTEAPITRPEYYCEMISKTNFAVHDWILNFYALDEADCLRNCNLSYRQGDKEIEVNFEPKSIIFTISFSAKVNSGDTIRLYKGVLLKFKNDFVKKFESVSHFSPCEGCIHRNSYKLTNKCNQFHEPYRL